MVTFEIYPLLQDPQVKDREETRFIPSLLQVKLGPLSRRRKGQTVQPLIHSPLNPLRQTSKLQRAILILLSQKPYTLSDLNRSLGKPLSVLWRSLQGLDRRGLLCHVWVTGCNYFGYPLTRHYFAPRAWGGGGSMAELLELAVRVLFIAARENADAIERQKDCYYHQMQTCVIPGSKHHTPKRALIYRARLTADTQPATSAPPPPLVLKERAWSPQG